MKHKVSKPRGPKVTVREAQKRILYPRMVPGVQLYPDPSPERGATAAAAHAHATSVSPFAVYRFIGLNDVAVKGKKTDSQR